jgi:hypothetical protein
LAYVIEDAGFAQGLFDLGVRVLPEGIDVLPQSVVEEERRLGEAGELLPEFSHIHAECVLPVDEVLRLRGRLDESEESLHN